MPEPPHTKRMHNVLPYSRACIKLLSKHAMRIGVDIRCGVRADKFLTQDERVTRIVASSRTDPSRS